MTLQTLTAAVAFFAALGCGLMAGLFFTFSNFVMRALAGLPPDKGIAAMQAVNVAVLNPLFLFVFSGTGVACVGGIVLVLLRGRQPGSACLLFGAILYVVGVVLVTARFNIPRNDALAALDTSHPESAAVWRDYVRGWTAWNHVRAVAALAATAALIVALCQLRRTLP